MTRPVRRCLAAAVALLATVLLGSLVTPTSAESATLAPCVPGTLAKQVKQADVVFRGVVDKARPVQGKGKKEIRTYKVKADRVYRSQLVTDSVVVTAQMGVRCAPPVLKEGKRYIFFATEQGSRLVATASTARASKQLTAAVVKRLGDGEQPQPGTPAAAEFTRVADASPTALSRLLAPGAALLIVSLLGLLFVGRIGRRPASG